MTHYNVKVNDDGISAFQLKDTGGKTYLLCVLYYNSDCRKDQVYADFQPLYGPIAGFRVHTWDRVDPGLMNLPIEVSIVYNACPCELMSLVEAQAPVDMTAHTPGLGTIEQSLQFHNLNF